MEILVVSDTHNNMQALNKILGLSKKADYIFHLGDNISDARYLDKKFEGTVHMVKGNCDSSELGDVEKLVEIEGKKFFITHGDKYEVYRSVDKLYYKGLEVGADVVMFGHTHRKLKVEEEGLIILNPGSISLPRDNSRSIAKIIIDNNKKINVEFLEF